jgi:branched-chain amino acid transport system ATP-binding protein
MALLSCQGVVSGYGNIQVLKRIDLEINSGEVVCLIGANGAGKTTTLMTICGIVKATTGKIIFNEQDITGMSPERIVHLGISQVPEGRRIFPRMTVVENLQMGAYLQRGGNTQAIETVLALFPQLTDRRNQKGGTLSGGEQQMLAIGRALMAKPKLLILDEPSLGLAPLVVKRIFEIIQRINSEGVTIFLVEQNARLALAIANRGYVMETGKIVLSDEAGALLKNEMVKKAYLGEST